MNVIIKKFSSPNNPISPLQLSFVSATIAIDLNLFGEKFEGFFFMYACKVSKREGITKEQRLRETDSLLNSKGSGSPKHVMLDAGCNHR